MEKTTLILLVLIGVPALILGTLVFGLIGAYVKALFNQAPVPISKLLAMKFAGIPFGLIVDARITAVRAGIALSADEVASHFQAGGNVVPTVQAIIAAQKAGIELNWNRACAIDLATKGSGKSVVEAVRTSVDPKVIDCPNPASGRTTIDGVAKDGIQVNSVSPGPIATQFNIESYGRIPGRTALMESRVPAGRFGREEEIAEVVVFLATTEGSYIQGHDLVVDGGYVIH
jgi:uncharacterized protein YqfA (UPF0365 family)